MAESLAELIWLGLGVYLMAGGFVATWLLAGGLNRFDPIAAQAPWRVKAVIAPGLIALWPAVALRALGLKPREDRP